MHQQADDEPQPNSAKNFPREEKEGTRGCRLLDAFDHGQADSKQNDPNAVIEKRLSADDRLESFRQTELLQDRQGGNRVGRRDCQLNVRLINCMPLR